MKTYRRLTGEGQFWMDINKLSAYIHQHYETGSAQDPLTWVIWLRI